MFRKTVIILVILLFAIWLMSVMGCGCGGEETITNPGTNVEENTATTTTQTATQQTATKQTTTPQTTTPAQP